MRGLLLVPLAIGGVLGVNYLLAAWKQPAPPAVMVRREPREDWSGIWGEKTSSALLRLRHKEDGSLIGEYAPPRDRAVLCPFSQGMVEGDTARFDVRIDAQLWHCRLVRSGNSATLRGRKDMDALLDACGKDDRMPNGGLIISPRNWDKRVQTTARLQRKREEIRQAAAPLLLGVFERIEVQR